MKVSITCKQAVDYVSKKEEGKLSSWQRMQLWRHVAVCSLCRLFALQNKIIIKSLSEQNQDQDYHLPEEKKQEIIEAALNDKK